MKVNAIQKASDTAIGEIICKPTEAFAMFAADFKFALSSIDIYLSVQLSHLMVISGSHW